MTKGALAFKIWKAGDRGRAWRSERQAGRRVLSPIVGGVQKKRESLGGSEVCPASAAIGWLSTYFRVGVTFEPVQGSKYQ